MIEVSAGRTQKAAVTKNGRLFNWEVGGVPFSAHLSQGCHHQGKISGKRNFFQVREMSGKFVDGQGNLERTWKVRKFENKWLWQAVFRKCIILFKREMDVLSHERV